uniref:S100 calcium binding protein A10a n=3 Tax=Salarias fasciatus TaxID=181472 RepID=A0A672ITB1_SALFA
MPSDVESAMESLILVFHRYASEEGGYYTVSRDKLKQLMKTELPSYLQAQKDPAVIDKMMKDLDASGGGQINFEQFFCLIAGFSISCEKAYQMKLKKTKKK